MRKGQRCKFIGHANYEGNLQGGELLTVTSIEEYFASDNLWCFEARLDTGETEFLLSDMIEILTEEDDLNTLRLLIDKYPEQAKRYIERRNK